MRELSGIPVERRHPQPVKGADAQNGTRGDAGNGLRLTTKLRHVAATTKPVDTTLRVIKKIAPNSRGAKGLSTTYGDQLVCVRHRLDSTGTRRLTTVELVVAETVIARRPGPTVDIDVHPRENDLRAKLKAAGARWDKTEMVWRIRRSTAIALGLKSRIVPRKP